MVQDRGGMHAQNEPRTEVQEYPEQPIPVPDNTLWCGLLVV
jgi:hypothetical protein